MRISKKIGSANLDVDVMCNSPGFGGFPRIGKHHPSVRESRKVGSSTPPYLTITQLDGDCARTYLTPLLFRKFTRQQV